MTPQERRKLSQIEYTNILLDRIAQHQQLNKVDEGYCE